MRFWSTTSVTVTCLASASPWFLSLMVQSRLSPGSTSPPFRSWTVFCEPARSAAALTLTTVGSSTAGVAGSSLATGAGRSSESTLAWLAMLVPSSSGFCTWAVKVSVTVAPGGTEASCGVAGALQRMVRRGRVPDPALAGHHVDQIGVDHIGDAQVAGRRVAGIGDADGVAERVAGPHRRAVRVDDGLGGVGQVGRRRDRAAGRVAGDGRGRVVGLVAAAPPPCCRRAPGCRPGCRSASGLFTLSCRVRVIGARVHAPAARARAWWRCSRSRCAWPGRSCRPARR